MRESYRVSEFSHIHFRFNSARRIDAPKRVIELEFFCILYKLKAAAAISFPFHLAFFIVFLFLFFFPFALLFVFRSSLASSNFPSSVKVERGSRRSRPGRLVEFFPLFAGGGMGGTAGRGGATENASGRDDESFGASSNTSSSSPWR